MKICNKCKRVLKEDDLFCPECGERVVSTTTANQTYIPESYRKNQGSAWEKDDEKFYIRWLPSILALVGLFIFWEIYMYLGVAMGALAVYYGLRSNRVFNKVISVGVAVIMVIILFMIWA